MEKKFSNIEIEAVADDGTVEGYASRFGIEDQGGDVVLAGAYKNSLKKRLPKMLWQHETDKPIGKWIEATEDAEGLRVKGKLLLATHGGAKHMNFSKRE